MGVVRALTSREPSVLHGLWCPRRSANPIRTWLATACALWTVTWVLPLVQAALVASLATFGLACAATVAYGYVARERRLTTGVWTSAAIGTTVLFLWSWAAILFAGSIASIVSAVVSGSGDAFAGLVGIALFGALVSLAFAVAGYALLVVLLTIGAVLASTVRWLGGR